MKIETSNKQIIKQLNIRIELENDEEVNAFQNILSLAEHKLHETNHGGYPYERYEDICKLLNKIKAEVNK